MESVSQWTLVSRFFGGWDKVGVVGREGKVGEGSERCLGTETWAVNSGVLVWGWLLV